MILIKSILLFIVMLFIFYRAGLIINKILKKNNFINIILYGFMFTVAILQIIYIPLILLHVAFNVVLYTTLAVLLIIVALSFYLNKFELEKKLFKQNVVKIKTMKKRNIIITGLVFVVVFAQAITASLLFNENADDSFYVSLVEQNKTSESIYNIDPSTGTNNLEVISRYVVSGHELALSVISQVFGIPSTTLCHTVIPFIMIILAYMAYYVFARKFLNNEKAQIFVLLLGVLFLFSGFTSRLRGEILLSRMWQGKEIFLNIVLTLILSNLINITKYNRKKNLTALMTLNFAAVFFTSTAIFLVPFAYLGIAVIKVIKKRWKTLLGLIITGIPIAIYGVIYLCTSQNMDTLTSSQINLIDILKDYMGTGYYWVLYIASLIIIAFRGTGRARRYFLFVPIIYLLTIYNPLFTDIITKYFTTTEVFWRLFWLLPMEFSIVYSFILLLDFKDDKKYKAIVFGVEIILLILLGKFVFIKDNGFETAENLNKIPQSIMNQTQYILDVEKQFNNNERQITVMAPPEPLHSATMRQLTSEINLFWSRTSYIKDMNSKETLDEMNKLYVIYQGIVPEVSTEEFNALREKYEINWIISNKNHGNVNEYLDQIENVNKSEMDGYYLYQY